ncbi:TPA: helix-turn-helix transcriptional regulator [Streptococcus equi subsp. zooepidemicus]|nr:helix-turn-helix transcriptional regulator [Streptococcus equi subsp. zooepidemicus]HEL0675171.1 helix-turn-helix transcriptional regulator [Streptococcus equi subsp. zooepidemicus]HEL1217607.1 helix-turn-helix transcriptional regulator [Streptococcus equi subsp. zooepidemicus]
MRWDFGAVYKEIRENKGLSQQAVVGEVISRQTLISFEKGESTPRYETVMFLLRQIDMTFGEFEYICNGYHPNQRQEILKDITDVIRSGTPEDFKATIKKCDDYLSTRHDFPIKRYSKLLKTAFHIKSNGFSNIPEEIHKLTAELWRDLAQQDVWYESDLRILNAILYHFPIENIHHIVNSILDTFERYKHYMPIKDKQLTILENLTTLYLHHGKIKDCIPVLNVIVKEARKGKKYDIVAFYQVRLGICTKNQKLMDKGLQMLEWIEEEELLHIAKLEMKHFLNL